MRIILIAIFLSACGSNPNTCDTYNPLKNDSSIFDSPNTKSCKRELELCRMDNYRKQVDLNDCKRNNTIWRDVIVAALGVLSGYLAAK